jgi:SAM-dependent methyltransferase
MGSKTFTADEMNHIYNTEVKLPSTYFRKYEILPDCPIKSYNYNWGGHDFPRCWTTLDFIEWIKKHNINIEHLGYTCDTDPELEFIMPLKKTLISYPGYDLHEISSHFKSEFDFLLFNQTIEHLYNPFEAMKQVYDTVKPGGYVFTSVPTINIPHMTPIHFNGYNPMGLAMLFKSVNFEIVEIGQWGNLNYISKLFTFHHWPSYYDLNNNNKNNPIVNEERNVCQCWILAKKPLV